MLYAFYFLHQFSNKSAKEPHLSTLNRRNSNATKGTDAKVTSHVENTIDRDTVAQDTVQQLIAFASTILVYPVKSGGRFFIEK